MTAAASFCELLDGADLLIENFAPGTLAALVSRLTTIAKFPKLSVISISNFGQDGPERDGRLNDLVLFARGGWTFPVGERDREPLTPPGSLAQYVAALYGAIAAMQALAARDLGLGHGQHLDVSILEATVATMIYETVTFQSTGIVRGRAGKRFAVGPFLIVTLKCKDGYAGLHCVTDKQFEGLCDLMGRRELASDPRFNTRTRPDAQQRRAARNRRGIFPRPRTQVALSRGSAPRDSAGADPERRRSARMGADARAQLFRDDRRPRARKDSRAGDAAAPDFASRGSVARPRRDSASTIAKYCGAAGRATLNRGVKRAGTI